MLLRFILASAAALGMATAAAAHHSAALFDTSIEVVLEGTVAEVEWKNPHIYLAIETTGPDGEPVIQAIEASSSSVLLPLGFARDSVQVGEHVTVRVNPGRSAGRTVKGVFLTKADGSIVPLALLQGLSAAELSETTANSIAGTWVAQTAGFAEIYAARSTWPLTNKAQEATAAFDIATETTQIDCRPFGAPTLMMMPVVRTIEVGEETVVIDLDWLGARRIVHMGLADHPADVERTEQGHSIGHWEGETLVVDTIAFTDHPEGLLAGVPNGAGKHLVERFSVSPGGRTLDYEVTVEDPDYLLEPTSFSARWDYRPELESTGQACDPEVARRFFEDL